MIAGGCAAEDPAGPALVRWIEDEPRDLFSFAALGERRTVFELDFAATPVADGWSPVGTEWIATDSGLQPAPGARVLTLAPASPVDASALDVIELTLSSQRQARLKLSFEGGSLSLENARAQGPRQHRLFSLDLSSHPGWQGMVEGLTLQVELPAPEPFILRRLHGLTLVGDDDRVAAVAGRAFDVEIDHEVRPAILLDPRSREPITRELLIPPGAVLRYGLGVVGRQVSPIEFRIRAGDTTISRQVLSVEASGHEWQEVEIDLGSRAGDTLTLMAEAVGDPGPDAGQPGALVAWAHPEIAGATASPRRDLALISIDTLRADRLSLYGHDRPTSPRLDAWAKARATIFTRAVAAAPWTLPSHTSMLTGLQPLRHGVNHPLAVVPAGIETVAEQLRRGGYFTVAVTGGGWLHPSYGLAQGFDRYRFWPGDGGSKEDLAAQIADLEAALDSVRRPYFLFFHTYSVHDYMSCVTCEPESGTGAADPDLLRTTRYDRAVTTMDQRLGDVLERLSTNGTAVLVTSDHGEGLHEQEETGHGTLREHTLRVPLVVSVPGQRQAPRVDRVVSSVDLVPTVLELAGLPPAAVDGSSLGPRLRGEDSAGRDFALSYMTFGQGLALRLEDWKYTYDNSALATSHGREALYHLATDAREEHDLVPHERTETFRRLAHKLLAGSPPGLAMGLVNHGSWSMKGSLQGPRVQAENLKASHLSCRCVPAIGDGVAELSLPAGTDIELLLENAHAQPLTLSMTTEQGEARLEIDLSTLEGPSCFELAAGTWRPAACHRLERGVSLRWRGSRAPDSAVPFEADDELRQQLISLGYLDG